MAINIERLLRLTADYHDFCGDNYKKGNMNDSDELDEEELDFIFAASCSVNEEKREEEIRKTIY